MAKRITLQTEMRTATGTGVAKKLRRDGIAPGVIYGGGQRSYPVQMKEREISDLLKHSESENVLVNLNVTGAENPKKLVLIQDVQRHTINGNIMHIDFQTVREDHELKATLPVHLVGDSKGVKAGGVLEHQLHQLEVSCLPKDLPEIFELDISAMEIGDALRVGDINFPEGVTPHLGEDVLVVLVHEPRTATSEEEEAEAAATAASEPALVKDDKDGDDEDGDKAGDD